MNDDHIKEQLTRIGAPEPDVGGVVRRGRILKRRLWATRALSTLVIVALATSGVVFLPDLVSDHRETAGVPDEHAEAQEVAKAVRFGFHALIETGPYLLDYRGYSEVDGRYRLRFLDGYETEELRQNIESQEQALEAVPERIASVRQREEQLRLRLAQLQRKIEEASGERGKALERSGAQIEKRLRSLREEIDFLRGSARHFRTQLEDNREIFEEQQSSGGPHELVLVVERRGDRFFVADIEGEEEVDSIDEDRAKAILRFSEPVPHEAIGYEYFEPQIERTQEGATVMFRIFYVGPVPSPERVACTPTVLTESGRVVAKFEQLGENEIGAARSENERDGGGVGLALPDGAVVPDGEELMVETLCHQVEGYFVAVGDPRILPVRDGETNESTRLSLERDRHVWVETETVFVGKPYLGAQTICVAEVFDDFGELLGSHGLTLYGPSRERDFHITLRMNEAIKIAVDVGEPEEASSATVNCQPTIPGVPLGPDQE